LGFWFFAIACGNFVSAVASDISEIRSLLTQINNRGAGTEPSDDHKPIPQCKPDGSAWKDWGEYQEARDAWIRRDAVREFKKQNNPKTLPTTVFK
jgi:hypothetical protein